MFKSKDKKIAKLKKQGYAVVGAQHNGTLLVRITSENMIHRCVIDNLGVVRTYMPREAKEIEMQRFGFATGKEIGQKIVRNQL